ncbi:MAG: primosomal protein N' [Gammaproteobacteria bacterium]|nr:primosomal protein N' [Gammaproteobacteria bacterium]
MSQTILHIAVPCPLYTCLDYRLPDQFSKPVIGARVRVPFRQQQVIGIIMGIAKDSPIASPRLRDIIEPIDHDALLDTEILKLARWASQYYHYPIGEVVSTLLPTLLRQGQQAVIEHDPGWQLSEAGTQCNIESLQRSPRQQEILQYLQQYPQGMRDTQFKAQGFSLSAQRSLQQKGLIKRIKLEIDPSGHPSQEDKQHQLNSEQEQAVQAVRAKLDQFQTYLLEGITGSGKTEVYLQLIADMIRQHKQTLVIVPEIGLTPQLTQRFEARFSQRLAILHSGLNDKQRLSAWEMARTGKAEIIIGTRSAIFTPLPRVGLFIIDEEHDGSLKQQDGFRYSARDLLIWRANQANRPILLGSATPSLESLYNAQKGRYQHLLMPTRAGKAIPPHLQLLDVRGQQMRESLSQQLLIKIRQHLDNNGQALIFINRRGFSPTLMCHECGWTAECSRCNTHMTCHQGKNALQCHHCGSYKALPRQCPACQGQNLIHLGAGTERVEQALIQHFPDITVLRIDRDSTRRKGALHKLLQQAQEGRKQILLGTQMLAKGHHFPNVTLVAILDADQGLFSHDFRASERMAQLITQVAGRAGRDQQPGEVIIQTHHPEHPLLRILLTEGYAAFANATLKERAEARLPPFSYMAILRAEASNPQAPMDFLQQIADQLPNNPSENIDIWGPLSASMEKRAGRYRYQLILQATKRSALHPLLDQIISQISKLKSASKVRWSLDVDPIDTF